MKNQLYTALCCLIAGQVLAQQPAIPEQQSFPWQHTGPVQSTCKPDIQSLAKTTGTDMRLIATSYYGSNTQTQTFFPTDSTFFTYSGGRGGDLETPSLPFDNYTHFTFNTQGIAFNKNLYIQTFDGAGRISNYMQKEWDANIQSWVNKSQETYTYDAAGNKLTTLHQNWDAVGNTWKNYYRYSYTYDGLNQLTGTLSEKWNVNVWKNVDRNTYVFTNNLKTKHQWDTWDDNNNAWKNFYKYDYTYNSGGKCETETYSTWNVNTNAWQTHQLKTFTYNNALQETSVLQKTWQNNAWKNYSRFTRNYSNTGQFESALSEQWTNNAWVNVFRYDNTFDAQDRLSVENTRMWDNVSNAWKNYREVHYGYDNNGNMLSLTEKTPDANNNAIMHNKRLEEYTYNSSNKMTSETWKTWNLTQQVWQLTANDNHYRYYYESYNTTAVHQNKLPGTVKAYPNPASDVLQIDVQLEQPAALTLMVFDIAGRKRMQLTYPAAARHHDRLDVNSLSTGIYQVVMRTQDGQHTEKISIVR